MIFDYFYVTRSVELVIMCTAPEQNAKISADVIVYIVLIVSTFFSLRRVRVHEWNNKAPSGRVNIAQNKKLKVSIELDDLFHPNSSGYSFLQVQQKLKYTSVNSLPCFVFGAKMKEPGEPGSTEGGIPCDVSDAHSTKRTRTSVLKGSFKMDIFRWRHQIHCHAPSEVPQYMLRQPAAIGPNPGFFFY